MYFDTKKFRVSLRNHRKRLRSRAGPPAFFFFSRYGRACVIISFIERISPLRQKTQIYNYYITVST